MSIKEKIAFWNNIANQAKSPQPKLVPKRISQNNAPPISTSFHQKNQVIETTKVTSSNFDIETTKSSKVSDVIKKFEANSTFKIFAPQTLKKVQSLTLDQNTHPHSPSTQYQIERDASRVSVAEYNGIVGELLNKRKQKEAYQKQLGKLNEEELQSGVWQTKLSNQAAPKELDALQQAQTGQQFVFVAPLKDKNKRTKMEFNSEDD